jgi:hypothetical protein
MENLDPQRQGEDPNPTRRTRSLAEQHDLALAWFAACLTGGIAISVVPGSLGVLRMLTPLVAMGLFLAFGVTRSRFSTPRLADSIYFMGFLWTLWALIDVLAFSTQLKAKELYNAFGYALIATASGMFIRLGLLQFYRTVEDQEDQAVDSMDQAVTRLNTYVNGLTQEFERTRQCLVILRTDASSKINDWHKEFAEASRVPVTIVAEAANDVRLESKNLSSNLRELRDELVPITKSLKALEAKIAGVTVKLADTLERSSGALVAALEAFQASLLRVQNCPDELHDRIRQVSGALEKALVPLDKAAAGLLKDLSGAIGDLAKAVLEIPNDEALMNVTGKLVGQLEVLRTSTESLAGGAARVGNQFKQAGEQAGALSGSLIQSRSEMEKGLSSVIAHANELVGVIASARHSTSEVDTALKHVIHFVKGELARS